MVRNFQLSLIALALAACGSSQTQASENAAAPSAPAAATVSAAQPVTLTAADGVRVFGNYVPAAHPKAIILLFHQAGSGKGEYDSIAPKLAANGYSSLAIDQRAGGALFGTNETAKALGRSADYLDARPDLEAAFAWAKGKNLPIIVWGSSYSSSLVFPLAAGHPGEVKALLSFSPGEYFDDKQMIHRAAAKLTSTAVFVTSSQDPEEISAAKSILDAVPSANKEQFVPTKGGVHGSSTLLDARNPNGAASAWTAVLEFLDHATRS